MKLLLAETGPVTCTLEVQVSLKFVHRLVLVHLFVEYLLSLVGNSSGDAFSCVTESKNSKCASSYSIPPLSSVPLAPGKVTPFSLVDL